jgi:signal transduction histidine kinase
MQDIYREYPGGEYKSGASAWSGRVLTEGQRRMIKMVTPYAPAKTQHMKDMVGIVRLASEMAYHFNNILTVTTGYGDMLKMKMPKDDPSIAYVEKILASSRRAQDLVRGLFMFAGNERIRLREVELNRVIRRSARFLSPGPNGNVKTKTELDDGELFVMADVGGLEEVFKNLIENALEAMPEGGVLTLRTERIPPEDEQTVNSDKDKAFYASVTVTDTGVGMDRETRERIFDPFFSTKGQRHNAGLGMSKVYGIVKQHSGEIVVESSLGKGTSVNVRIPATRVRLKTTEPIPLPVSFVTGGLHVPGSYMSD